MTAAIGLSIRMGLPEPWSSSKPADGQKVPILVYGAASAVGAYAIQFARLSNLHPIIGVAGRGIPFAEGLIDKSKGDVIVDYRKGDEAVISGIKEALKASGLSHVPYVFDAVSEKGSHENIAAVIDSNGGQVTHVLPVESFARTKGFKYPDGVKPSFTMVGTVHSTDKDFGFLMFRYISRLLADGRLRPHPHEVIPGGLKGVRQGLLNLSQGKASATKYIFRVQETEAASSKLS
jgi:NADPH:quinone reductase